MRLKNTYLALAMLAGFGLALGACSSSSDDPPPTEPPVVEPQPTAYEAGLAAINAADTAAAAQAAYAAVDLAAVTGDEASKLRDALDAKMKMIAAAAAAAARQALVDAAAGCTDGTEACVTAHQALVDALTADPTTTVTALNVAKANLAAVQTAKAEADQAEADRIAAEQAAAALKALADAAAACTDGTQACVDANQAYVDALEADDSTSSEVLAAAQTALGNVQTAKADADAAADAAAARQALVDAAMCTDGTQACVDAHQALVDALDADPATSADALAAAKANLETVKTAKADADADVTRQALVDAAAGCTDGTEACVTAHQALVDALDADPATSADALAAAQADLEAVQMAKTEADAAAAAAAERQALVDAAAGCTDGTEACVTAHQALVDALEADDTTSDEDLATATANLEEVKTAKADADAAAARKVLVDAAAGCMDGTEACVTAHQALVDALDADDSTTADELDAAKANLGAVQMAKTAADKAAARKALVDAAACTDATQACVDAHKDLLTALQKDLMDLKADDSATQGEIKAAETAVAEATEALSEAQMDLDKHLAAQPPTYNMKALATALSSPTATHTAADRIDGGMPNTADTDNYAKATWPVDKLAGFGEAVYEDSTAGTSIVTYTNKSADMGAKYSEYYDHGTDSAVNGPPTTAIKTGYANKQWVGVTQVSTAGVVSFEDNVTKALISFSHGTGASSEKTHTFADNTETDTDESKFSKTGTFHGIPGTYKCGGSGDTACKSTANAKGELTALTGGGSDGWTFTPDKNTGGMTVAGVLSDADYLDFGYWVTTTAGADGPTYALGTFARGMTPADTVPNTNMSATYKGAAAGLYTRREYSGTTGAGDLTAAGRFTATADLTAYLGTYNIPDKNGVSLNVSNSIRGTISNFMDGGSPIDATWRVDLVGNVNTDDATISPLDNGALNAATLYGGSNTTVPTGISGEFDHTFSNGTVVGAFGATKQ